MPPPLTAQTLAEALRGALGDMLANNSAVTHLDISHNRIDTYNELNWIGLGDTASSYPNLVSFRASHNMLRGVFLPSVSSHNYE